MGLTEYIDNDFGTVSDMLPVKAGSAAGGSTSKIAVIADNTLGVIENEAVTFPVGNLLTEGDGKLTTEGAVEIFVDTGSVPSTCFLVSAWQTVYAVSSASIRAMNLDNGTVSTLEATSGTIPGSVTLGAVYRNRLFLAGDDNAVYASRQGDFQDWDYGADLEDSGAPFVLQLSESSALGGVPTALVPYRDAYMLCATDSDLWAIAGDPVGGGRLRLVSPDVGIIGSRAWCKVGPLIVFLSQQGLYSVRPDGNDLESLTDQRLPEELTNIDTSTITVSLVYHHATRGLHIFLKPSSGTGTHWYFDMLAGAFWADQFASDHEPQAVCRFGEELLIAGSDGYIRSVGGEDDDSTDIQSHVLLGPFRLAPTSLESVLVELGGSLGADSGDVTWRIVAGNSAADAADRAKTAIDLYRAGSTATAEVYAETSGTYSAGRNRTKHPRVRSPWYVIWLQSTNKWSYEAMIVKGREAGRYR